MCTLDARLVCHGSLSVGERGAAVDGQSKPGQRSRKWTTPTRPASVCRHHQRRHMTESFPEIHCLFVFCSHNIWKSTAGALEGE